LEIRFRLFLIFLMGLFAVTMWTFPQWYPVVNQETIAESFPGLQLEAQPDFLALPQAEQNAYLLLHNGNPELEITPRPDLALALVRSRLLSEDVQSQESLTSAFEPPSETILRRGEFRALSLTQQASGTATVYQRTDLSGVLILDEEFRSMRAPGVHLILTSNPDPTDAGGVGLYIDLGPLRANVGWQAYEVPRGVDFGQYPILALYSVPYDYVISTATLR